MTANNPASENRDTALKGLHDDVHSKDMHPFWATTLTGSEVYKDNAYGQSNDSVLTHEVAVGYQFSPRMNGRYFGNWNEYNSFSDGIHKVEFNY